MNVLKVSRKVSNCNEFQEYIGDEDLRLEISERSFYKRLLKISFHIYTFIFALIAIVIFNTLISK